VKIAERGSILEQEESGRVNEKKRRRVERVATMGKNVRASG